VKTSCSSCSSVGGCRATSQGGGGTRDRAPDRRRSRGGDCGAELSTVSADLVARGTSASGSRPGSPGAPRALHGASAAEEGVARWRSSTVCVRDVTRSSRRWSSTASSGPRRSPLRVLPPDPRAVTFADRFVDWGGARQPAPGRTGSHLTTPDGEVVAEISKGLGETTKTRRRVHRSHPRGSNARASSVPPTSCCGRTAALDQPAHRHVQGEDGAPAAAPTGSFRELASGFERSVTSTSLGSGTRSADWPTRESMRGCPRGALARYRRGRRAAGRRARVPQPDQARKVRTSAGQDAGESQAGRPREGATESKPPSALRRRGKVKRWGKSHQRGGRPRGSATPVRSKAAGSVRGRPAELPGSRTARAKPRRRPGARASDRERWSPAARDAPRTGSGLQAGSSTSSIRFARHADPPPPAKIWMRRDSGSCPTCSLLGWTSCSSASTRASTRPAVGHHFAPARQSLLEGAPARRDTDRVWSPSEDGNLRASGSGSRSRRRPTGAASGGSRRRSSAKGVRVLGRRSGAYRPPPPRSSA